MLIDTSRLSQGKRFVFILFVTFVDLPFSVRSLDLFCRFARVHEGHFMCNKEGFQVELRRKIVLWQIFTSHRSAWFPLLLSACRLVEIDTVVICHVFMHCSGSFL